MLVTAGLVTGVLAVAGCGSDATLAGSGTGRVAEFVPARTQVYFEISTDLESGQWKQAGDIASRFPAYQDLLRRARSGLAQNKLDFDRDLRPLLGDSAAVALPTVTTSDDPVVLIAVDIADGKESEVRDLLVRDGSLPDVHREHGGVTIHRSSDVYIAIFDEAVVASQSADAVVRSIDTRRGGADRSMAGSKKVRQALAGLPDEVLVQGYIDVSEIVAGVGAAQRPEVRRQIEASGISADAGLAISLSTESDGLRLKAVASKVANSPQVGLFAPSLTRQIPDDALAYVGADDLYAVIGATLGQLSKDNPALKDQLGQLRGALNLIGLPMEDLRNLTSGEFAAAVLAPSSGTSVPGGVAILEVEDGGKASATFDNVRKQLGLLAGGNASIPAFDRVRLGNGVVGWEGRLGSDVSIVYGVDDRRAMLGTSVDAVRSVQSPGSRLSDDRAFREATDQMPSEVQSLMWIDVESTLKVVDALAPGQLGAEARENLAPLRSVAGWSTAGDRPTFEVFFTIR